MDAETERYLTDVDQERITKEQDEEIMKIKQIFTKYHIKIW